MKKRRFIALTLLLALIMASAALAEAGGVQLQLVSVQSDGGTVGRCAVPEGCELSSAVSYCGAGQSLGYPMQLSIDARTPDGRTTYAYCSATSYLQILESKMNGQTVAVQQDGQYDVTTMTPMLTLRDAAGYADYMITSMYPGVRIVVADEAEITPEVQAIINQRMQQSYQDMNAIFAGNPMVSVDDVFFDVAERSYTFENDGEAYRATLLTVVDAMQLSQRMDSGVLSVEECFIGWEVPFVYALIAPEAEYEGARAAFDLFVLNTSASDSFNETCQALSNQIRTAVLESRSLAVGADSCRSGVSGLSDSASDYSAERFSDYLFSQDDYTLDDGRHVKIPIEYDYVYVGDNGSVYATDSALDEPAGMRRLEKNH